MTNVELLNAHLQKLPSGPICENAGEITSLVSNCWNDFMGHDSEGMNADKLIGRMKDLEWNSPEFSFKIERHGAFMLGSTRAEIQMWTLNLDTRVARCGDGGFRQMTPNAKALKVEPLAAKITKLILAGRKSPNLHWRSDGSVQVRIGRIIPAKSSPRRTITGRRKHFRRSLTPMLTPHGWTSVRENVYRKIVRPSESSNHTGNVSSGEVV